MTTSDRLVARTDRPTVLAARPALARAVVATLLVAGYVGAGFALRLDAEAYLVLGIPITIAFQAIVIRRPLRSLWLREAPPLSFTRRSIAAAAILAIAPAAVALRGVGAGNLPLVAWGAASMVGALGAAYALRAMNRDAVRSTIAATVVGGGVMATIMVGYRLATGGFDGQVVAAVLTTAVSVATYLPVVFVMEEVLFRGLIDPYLRGSAPEPHRPSALYGSALWGLWHVPVASVSLGLWTIPYLVIVHTAIGVVLVTSWRRTGNLAAPGTAHAVIDAVRNGIAVI